MKKNYSKEFEARVEEILEIAKDDLRFYNKGVYGVDLVVEFTLSENKGKKLIYNGKKDLQEGTIIGIYTGTIIKQSDVAKLKNSEYIMQFQSIKNFYIDAFEKGK